MQALISYPHHLPSPELSLWLWISSHVSNLSTSSLPTKHFHSRALPAGPANHPISSTSSPILSPSQHYFSSQMPPNKAYSRFLEQLAGYHEFPNSIQNLSHFPWFQHKEASQCSGKGSGITWIQVQILGQVTWFLWVVISSSSLKQLVGLMKVLNSEWHRVGLLHWPGTSLSTFSPTVPQELRLSQTSLKTRSQK